MRTHPGEYVTLAQPGGNPYAVTAHSITCKNKGRTIAVGSTKAEKLWNRGFQIVISGTIVLLVIVDAPWRRRQPQIGRCERTEDMAEYAEAGDVAFNLQLVREFLEKHFTIENEIRVLQQDKSELRNEFKGRGLEMKTMTAAIVIAKKRQQVPVSKETLDELIIEVENKLPAPED